MEKAIFDELRNMVAAAEEIERHEGYYLDKAKYKRGVNAVLLDLIELAARARKQLIDEIEDPDLKKELSEDKFDVWLAASHVGSDLEGRTIADMLP